MAKALALSGKGEQEKSLVELNAGIVLARELPAVPDFYLPLAKMLLERIKIHSNTGRKNEEIDDLEELKSIVDQLANAAPDGLRYLSVRAEYFAVQSERLQNQQNEELAEENLIEAIGLQERLFASRPYERIGNRLDEMKNLLDKRTLEH